MYQIIALVIFAGTVLYGIEHYKDVGRKQAESVASERRAKADAEEAHRQLREKENILATELKLGKQRGEENANLKLRNSALEKKLATLPADAQKWLDTPVPGAVRELRAAHEASRGKAGGDLVLGPKATGFDEAPATERLDESKPVDRSPRSAGSTSVLQPGQVGSAPIDSGAKSKSQAGNLAERISKMRGGK